MSEQNEIKLANQEHGFVPKEEYRRGRRKKLYNTIQAATTTARDMEDRGQRR